MLPDSTSNRICFWQWWETGSCKHYLKDGSIQNIVFTPLYEERQNSYGQTIVKSTHRIDMTEKNYATGQAMYLTFEILCFSLLHRWLVWL